MGPVNDGSVRSISCFFSAVNNNKSKLAATKKSVANNIPVQRNETEAIKTQLSYTDFLHTLNDVDKSVDSSQAKLSIESNDTSCSPITSFFKKAEQPFKSLENKLKTVANTNIKVEAVVHSQSPSIQSSPNENICEQKPRAQTSRRRSKRMTNNVALIEKDFDLSITHVETTYIDMEKSKPVRKAVIRETDSPQKKNVPRDKTAPPKPVFNIFNIKSSQGKNAPTPEQKSTKEIKRSLKLEKRSLAKKPQEKHTSGVTDESASDVVLVEDSLDSTQITQEQRKSLLSEKLASMTKITVGKKTNQSTLNFGQKPKIEKAEETQNIVTEETADHMQVETLDKKIKRTRKRKIKKEGVDNKTSVKSNTIDLLDYSEDTIEYKLEVVKTPRSRKKQKAIKIKIKR